MELLSFEAKPYQRGVQDAPRARCTRLDLALQQGQIPSQDWPGLQLGPTSWIERGQIWSLELQPYDATTPPVSDLEGSAEGAEHLKAQRRSEEGEGIPLAQRQTQETFTTLKPRVDQNSATKRWYACDRCDKEFQWLSHLNQHKNSHPGRNAPRQSRRWGQNQAAVSSPDLLAPVSGPRQNLLAGGNKRAPQNSGKGSNQAKRTKRLLICTWCGRDFRWPSHLARHYRIKCYINKIRRRRKLPKEGSQGSVAPEAAPVEATKITADAGETGQHKSAPTTDQAPSVSSLCICEQCGQGFQWLSDLAQHQRTHSRRKTVRPNVCQLESCCPRATVPTVQHGEKGIAKSCKMPSQTSKRAPCTKDLHLYDQRREDIERPSACAHHCQNMCSAGKAIRSNQDQVGEDKLSLEKPASLPQKVKTVFVDASETLGQKSELTTDPITHSKDLLLCELCGKGFRYLSLLARHQQGHYGKEQASQHQYHSNAVSPDPWKRSPYTLASGGSVCKFAPSVQPKVPVGVGPKHLL
ncbi:hypothetical protein JRQ81_005590 [Phrynocephalus forsythii]|uniref:C2H2-type domain-containing protein n=1 Tax=Phrynocephalus forsythii TaxID=171643 RepID=A0A9Q1AVP9_9SAUR|nr:hypothetical protein JRQ81_005590 [Phrynocephalus forsythii]